MFGYIIAIVISISVIAVAAIKMHNKKKEFYGNFHLGEITKKDVHKDLKKYERKKQNNKRRFSLAGFASRKISLKDKTQHEKNL